MAYFYNSSSNYSEVPDNYQYYQYYYNHDYSTNYDPRYVNYYDTEFHGNAYQHAPTQPLVGYYYSNYCQPESLTSKNAVFNGINDYYNEPVSTEYVVYHNTTTNAEATNVEVEGSDVVSEEYNPQPFHGGYDINEEYGKPMSPNEKICYPKDEKVDLNNATSLGDFSYGAVPSPYVKDDKKVEIESKEGTNDGVGSKEVIHEEDASDFDDEEDEDEDDYDDYEDDEDSVDGVVDEGDKKGGEKKDDLGKEAAESAAVVAALGAGAGAGAAAAAAAAGAGAVNKKEEQNLEGVARPKGGGSAGEVIQEKKEGVAKPKDGGSAGEVIQEKKASDFEAAKEGEEDDDGYVDDNEGQKEKGEEKQGVLVNKEPPKTIIPIAPLNDGPNGKEAPKFEDEAKPKNGSVGGEVIKEQPPSNFEREKEDINKGGSIVDQGTKEEDQGTQIRRQIPPGYGMEALDICEGLFGGYFPCLWKRKQRNNINTNTIVNQQSGYYENMSDYDYCCKETVDYLFGNPNPYGGSMPEKGSYGDPMYSYQRYYPQQPLSERVEYYGGNSSLMHHGSRYYYGYNNGDYQ